MADKEKVTRVFQMNLDTCEKFFTIVKTLTDRGVKDTREMRMEVLNYLAQEGDMERVYDTKRAKDEILSDFKKQGFSVDDRTGGDNG